MTPRLARKLFDILLDGLREHGLEEVATFALQENSLADQFSEFDDNYRYDSTEVEILRMQQLAVNSSDGAFTAMNEITRAAVSYFESILNISQSYGEKVSNLDANLDTWISIELPDESIVDINKALNDPAIKKIAELMRFILDNRYLEDRELQQRLNEYPI
jgi:hypothetical protein